MSGPKTVKEAMALKEISPSEILSDKIFLAPSGLTGDTICLFVDSDDVSKKVECIRYSRNGSDEWVKVVF